MKQNSYKRIIIKYLKDLREHSPDGKYPYGGWVLAGKIRSVQTPFGFIGFRGDRDIRELVKADFLEADYEGNKRVVRYKYPIPKSPEQEEEEARQRLIFATS